MKQSNLKPLVWCFFLTCILVSSRYAHAQNSEYQFYFDGMEVKANDTLNKYLYPKYFQVKEGKTPIESIKGSITFRLNFIKRDTTIYFNKPFVQVDVKGNCLPVSSFLKYTINIEELNGNKVNKEIAVWVHKPSDLHTISKVESAVRNSHDEILVLLDNKPFNKINFSAKKKILLLKSPKGNKVKSYTAMLVRGKRPVSKIELKGSTVNIKSVFGKSIRSGDFLFISHIVVEGTKIQGSKVLMYK